MSSSLFTPFGRTISLKVCGHEFDVPEKTQILRCLQYLYPEDISLGDFCWNNECGNCEVVFRQEGEKVLRRTRCCQFMASDGMELVDLSPELERCVGRKIRSRSQTG